MTYPLSDSLPYWAGQYAPPEDDEPMFDPACGYCQIILWDEFGPRIIIHWSCPEHGHLIEGENSHE